MFLFFFSFVAPFGIILQTNFHRTIPILLEYKSFCSNSLFFSFLHLLHCKSLRKYLRRDTQTHEYISMFRRIQVCLLFLFTLNLVRHSVLAFYLFHSFHSIWRRACVGRINHKRSQKVGIFIHSTIASEWSRIKTSEPKCVQSMRKMLGFGPMSILLLSPLVACRAAEAANIQTEVSLNFCVFAYKRTEYRPMFQHCIYPI